MYCVLIVEDEPNIRDSLAECMPWQNWGFTVYGTADNGRAAMEQIRKKAPDVVITDIRMPVMDGIVLLKEIHVQAPHIPVVILSGYDDFEYARQAISLGAYAYLLKIEIRSKLEQLMLDIRKELDVRLNDRVKRNREKNALIRQILIQTMLGHDPKMLTGFESVSSASHQYHLAVLRVEGRCDGDDSNSRGKHMYLLERYLEGRLKPVCCQHLVLSIRENEFILLFIKKKADLFSCEAIASLYQSLSLELPQQPFARDMQIVIAPGSYFCGFEKLYEAYHLVCSRPFLYSPARACQLIEEKCTGAVPPDEILHASIPLERSIIDGVQLQNTKYVMERLDRWLKHWQDADPVDAVIFKQRCIWLYYTIQNSLSDENLPGFMRNELNALAQLNSMSALSRWMLTNVACLLNQRNGSADDLPSRIQKTKQYLKNHYIEKITINELAEKMHMNPSYLSTCFKKETGKSFGEYYASLRMEKAKNLLENGYKVNRVSEMMCYGDTKSFRRMFRLHMGVNPGDIIRRGDGNPEL